MPNDELEELPRGDSWRAQDSRLMKYEALLRSYKSRLATQKDKHVADPDTTKLEEEIAEARDWIDEKQQWLNSSVKGEFISVVHKVTTAGLKRELRRFGQYMSRLPTDLDMPQHEEPFRAWRRSLDYLVAEIKYIIEEERGEQVSEAQKHAARVATQVQAYLETVRLLEERCEADVRTHPQQETEIRRRYRQAIDAIKDSS